MAEARRAGAVGPQAMEALPRRHQGEALLVRTEISPYSLAPSKYNRISQLLCSMHVPDGGGGRPNGFGTDGGGGSESTGGM